MLNCSPHLPIIILTITAGDNKRCPVDALSTEIKYAEVRNISTDHIWGHQIINNNNKKMDIKGPRIWNVYLNCKYGRK
jgi:hypothetical protein